MNKKLIALAVAGAVAAPAVMAENSVTLYGQARVGLEQIKANSTDTAASISKTRVADWTSRLGFKGQEELGGGMKAVWQVEQAVKLDDGTSGTFASRNSFIGLAGGFGAVKLGRHDTPYKLTGDLTSGMVGSADINGAKGLMHRADRRADNAVWYESPSMGGFTASVMYATAENKEPANATDKAIDTSLWSANAVFKGNMFEGGIGYVHHEDAGLDFVGIKESTVNGTTVKQRVGADVKADAFIGFAAVKFGPAKITTALEHTEEKRPAAGANSSFKRKRDSWMLGATYDIGAVQLRAAYVEARKLKSASFETTDDTGAKQFMIGAGYAFSKRTEAMAFFTKIDNQKNAAFDFDTNSLGVKAGQDPQAFGVGLRHKF
ncbi:putative porin [Chitinivorax tropicus]|uniref:Putative porin n=1 Tax=Chitinivorax tropicus TaxID=714531 RepID=A0A840MN86_9PROT|nr:porin [Chitinivorax tropicus]MBB5018437.1 putative porin [Chitinivorax tropicus]